MTGQERLWSQVFIISVLINFGCNTAQQMSNGMMAVYIDSIGGNAGFSGLLAAFFAVASITFRIISGKMFDRFGGKFIIIAGGLIYTAASIMYPVLSTLELLLLLRFGQGIGFSMIGTASNSVAAKCTPPSRLGEGLSYFGMMAALGTAVGPTLGVVIWRKCGSPAIFIVLSAVTLVISFVALVGGLDQGGSKPFPKEMKKAAQAQRKVHPNKAQAKSATVAMLIAIPQAFALTYIILYGDIHKCAVVDYFFAISAGAMIASRAIFGKSYDRYGVRGTLVPAIGFGIVSMVLLWLCPNTVGFIVGAILYGASYGVITPVLTAETVRVAAQEQKGRAVAVYYVGYDLGIGVGSLIWGAIIDYFGYNVVFLLSVMILAAAAYGSIRMGREAKR